MASQEINVVAILYPKKGKADQVIELLQGVAKYVEKQEPFVLKYEINRSVKPNKDGTEDIIMLETYKNQQGLQTHGSSATFKQFGKTLAEQDLLRAPMTLKLVSSQGGVLSRL